MTSEPSQSTMSGRAEGEPRAAERKRIRSIWIQFFCVAGALLMLNGCGGGSSSSSVQTQPGNQDFQISAPSLTPATIYPGSKTASTVTITAENGFNGTVALACSGLPASSASCSFSPSSITGSGTSQLTVTTTAAIAPGRYAFAVSGSSSSLSNSTELALGVAQQNGVIESTYFGIHGHNLQEGPWNQIAPFSADRLWGTGAAWPQLQQTNGAFNWQHLDAWMAVLAANGVTHVEFTLSGVARWASSDPNNTIAVCDLTSVLPPTYYGSCDPPSDLNSDGTGADQYWRNWVAAVAQRLQSDGSTYGITIDSYEPWNEFTRETDNTTYGNQVSWAGNNQQLVRMVQDARCIIVGNLGGSQATEASGGQTCAQVLQSVGLSAPVDPSALFLSPSTGIGYSWLMANWDSYINTPGAADAADAFAPHLYKINPVMPPETVILPALLAFESDPAVAAGVQVGKPVWATEGSWDENSDLPDADDQAAYVTREFLILSSTANIPRYYWYSLDDACKTPGCDNVSDSQGGGTLIIPPGFSTCTNPNGCIQEAGTAYGQVFKWMVGATQTTPCAPISSGSTIWTCEFSRSSPAGYQAEAIWDISQTCSPSCTTTPVQVSSTYVQYRDLDGNVTPIANSTVPVGELPILLEN